MRMALRIATFAARAATVGAILFLGALLTDKREAVWQISGVAILWIAMIGFPALILQPRKADRHSNGRARSPYAKSTGLPLGCVRLVESRRSRKRRGTEPDGGPRLVAQMVRDTDVPRILRGRLALGRLVFRRARRRSRIDPAAARCLVSMALSSGAVPGVGSQHPRVQRIAAHVPVPSRPGEVVESARILHRLARVVHRGIILALAACILQISGFRLRGSHAAAPTRRVSFRDNYRGWGPCPCRETHAHPIGRRIADASRSGFAAAEAARQISERQHNTPGHCTPEIEHQLLTSRRADR